MTKEAIGFILKKLRDGKIPIEFGGHTGDLKFPIWTAFYREFPSESEDGSEKGTLVLTGTTNSSYEELLNQIDTIKNIFPRYGSARSILKSGNGLVVSFSDSYQLPNQKGLETIEAILSVEEWSV